MSDSTPVPGELSRATPEVQKYRPRACQSCARSKMRCVWPSEPGATPCQRYVISFFFFFPSLFYSVCWVVVGLQQSTTTTTSLHPSIHNGAAFPMLVCPASSEHVQFWFKFYLFYSNFLIFFLIFSLFAGEHVHVPSCRPSAETEKQEFFLVSIYGAFPKCRMHRGTSTGLFSLHPCMYIVLARAGDLFANDSARCHRHVVS